MVTIHPTAEVHSQHIAEGTYVWQHSVVLEGAVIGKNCNICSHSFIENDVKIGDSVTVKNGVYLWDGISLEDDVFIGPNATFTNDKTPRSKQYQAEVVRTMVKKGASIGAGAVLIGPISIGEFAMVGAGAVVTKDVPAYTLVVGNPARVVGKVKEDGTVVSDELK